MKVTRKVTYHKKLNFLNWVQYVLGISIAVLFGLGLIPFYYDDVSKLLFGFLIVQSLLSLVRFRFANVILEFLLIVVAVFSLIPFLGYLFRFIGVLLSILDLSMFKSTVIYKRVHLFKEASLFKDMNLKKKKTDKKPKKDFKDAEFKEK